MISALRRTMPPELSANEAVGRGCDRLREHPPHGLVLGRCQWTGPRSVYPCQGSKKPAGHHIHAKALRKAIKRTVAVTPGLPKSTSRSSNIPGNPSFGWSHAGSTCSAVIRLPSNSNRRINGCVELTSLSPIAYPSTHFGDNLSARCAGQWSDRIGRRLKPRDLHVFLAAAENGNMAKAAEQLAISRPVVSKTISDLEHTLG